MGERDEGGLGVDDAADQSDDPRIRAVLGVLGGAQSDVAAARWAVDPMLLARWVRAFVEAGTAQVTNRPVGDIARRRDRFLTTFMHGLRSPLAVAQVWVGLLQDAAPLSDTVAEIAVQLQKVLDELDERALDVELITAAMLGRLDLDSRQVTVDDLVQRLKPVPEVSGEGGAVELTVDPALFARILRDLQDAALHAGAPADSVHVEVETIEPWLEIRVVRRGAPIDPAILHAMFEPFDRDDGNVRVTVGLYLARALTVVHGGTVGVEQDDQSTRFAVRIPDTRLTGPSAVTT